MSAIVGVILPDDGPFDYEWLRLDPWLARSPFQSLSVIIERSPADGIMRKENLLAIGSEASLAPVAQRLAQRGADCILWACTSGSFAGGHRAAKSQLSMLTDASGKPATSTSIALAAAARSLNAPDVDLLSAYDTEVTAIFTGFLNDAGVTVVKARSLDCIHTEESFAIDIVNEVTLFASRVDSRRPILIPDTAINTLDLIGNLERIAERPVVTANQASLWHAAHLLGQAPADVATAFKSAPSPDHEP